MLCTIQRAIYPLANGPHAYKLTFLSSAEYKCESIPAQAVTGRAAELSSTYRELEWPAQWPMAMLACLLELAPLSELVSAVTEKIQISTQFSFTTTHLHLVSFTIYSIYSRRHVCLHLLKLSLFWNPDSIIFFPFLKKRLTSSEAPFHYLFMCLLTLILSIFLCKTTFLSFSNIKL